MPSPLTGKIVSSFTPKGAVEKEVKTLLTFYLYWAINQLRIIPKPGA
jgi:hypothetical protein